ncbi:glycosyltransferase [Puia sp. P3]|uniref:glycosyltransferase n=1 Tax=Puia sp. P3 TaxID=3423952 RepID=UPI003D676F68
MIPYGIWTDIFKPTAKQGGGNTGKIVVLASAASLSHVNKGFHILLHTLQNRGDNSDIRLLIMGEDSEVRNVVFPGTLEVEFLGFVSAKEEKAAVYNRADCLAFPSFADNLPNSVIESVSCGTPVIAFNAGGMPDLVIEGVSGWICDKIDLDEYAEDIRIGYPAAETGRPSARFLPGVCAKEFYAGYTSREIQRTF